MAMIDQQTFIDRLNNAEASLSELANYADHMASRLVGYADEAENSYPDTAPSSGYLPGIGDTALRMSRKIESIRRTLNRIAETLPSEVTKTYASQQDLASGSQVMAGQTLKAW